MEVELEPRVKPLPYKVKGMSRESPSQKGAQILDTDLRSHWSTGTNTKEWILLELDEPCLLSHIKIYNKSVLEWEISVGLRYKPETFVKVCPHCEAPRCDMMYPMNYTPCCYLLQDMTNWLTVFLPQLEAELNSFSDAAEPNIRFVAMLAGPLYPILHIVNERETARLAGSSSDSEASKSSHPSSALLVSSNFEAKAACVLIDLCSGVLAPWMAQVIAKVDPTLELLEDLLGVIQGARHSLTHARAALKYIVLALSGHMDDIMAKYKEVKHRILFLVEMLEPFLDPAITP